MTTIKVSSARTIRKLQRNTKPFGLLSPQYQKLIKDIVGSADTRSYVEYYGSNRWQRMSSYNCYSHTVYRLRKDIPFTVVKPVEPKDFTDVKELLKYLGTTTVFKGSLSISIRKGNVRFDRYLVQSGELNHTHTGYFFVRPGGLIVPVQAIDAGITTAMLNSDNIVTCVFKDVIPCPTKKTVISVVDK